MNETSLNINSPTTPKSKSLSEPLQSAQQFDILHSSQPFFFRNSSPKLTTHQPFSPEPSEAVKNLLSKKHELESRFNKAIYRGYLLWLYGLTLFSIILCLCTILIPTFINIQSAAFSMSFLCSVWMIVQCWIEIKAIKNRNPPKARFGMKLMIVFGPFLGITLLLLAVSSLKEQEANISQSLSWIFFCIFFVLLLIHLAVNLSMAVKVKNLLTRVETLNYVLLQKTLYLK